MRRGSRRFQPSRSSPLVLRNRGSTADAHQVHGHRKTERATTASRWSARCTRRRRRTATTFTRPKKPWKYRWRASSPRHHEGRVGAEAGDTECRECMRHYTTCEHPRQPRTTKKKEGKTITETQTNRKQRRRRGPRLKQQGRTNRQQATSPEPSVGPNNDRS